ncbi:MAG TPA: HIT family protein [Caldimonas sp.]|jgi:histidine triad (HIT) family protein|nr:HIT family protein [Caldimonas sp.]
MSNMSECIFCRIASGAVHAHFVYRSPRVVAFLDIHPIRAGHVQIIPREHLAYFDSLPAEVSAEIFNLAQRLAPVLRQRWNVERVAFLFTGTDIAHAHAHVLPLVEPTDITSRRYIAEEHVSFQGAPRAPDSELAATAAVIEAALRTSPGEFA